MEEARDEIDPTCDEKAVGMALHDKAASN